MKYGIWIESPGKWTGWLSMALGDKRYPISFGEAEVKERVGTLKSSGVFPDAIIEARTNPPAEMPWNEDEWRKATA